MSLISGSRMSASLRPGSLPRSRLEIDDGSDWVPVAAAAAFAAATIVGTARLARRRST